MASLNPFDLLGDDAEDPSQIVLSLPKKVEKAAPVQPAKAAKFPTKPSPPSQAVRESRNGPSGGHGGGGGRGPPRGSFNPGGNRPHDPKDGPKDGERNGGFRGYRESGGRGGHIGGFANGKAGDVERPRRVYDRRSGTGRSNDVKREGGGRGNWGTPEDDIQPATEEPTTEVEKSPVAEKEGGEDATTDAKKEAPEVEQEPEDKEMTLEEYEKILEEKKKALQATKVEERKVDTKVFESMQQLSNKKTNDEEIFIKLGSDKDKRKDAAEKEEKAKKSLSINEFLKPANGETYNPRGGYRGRGGRSGGRGQRDGKVNGGGNQRNGGASAPGSISLSPPPSLPDRSSEETYSCSRITMATQAASFSGNLKKAVAGIKRINLDGLRWRVFDAKGQVLGRLASQISTVLQAKDKPTYCPNRDDGDICIVLNAKDIGITGRKLTDKFYRWHTGYVGHLKERSLKDQMAKDPTEVIRKAVWRMLPTNNLRDDRDRKLRIFEGSEHPFGDKPLEPFVMPPRTVREMRPRARRAMIRAQKKAEQAENGGAEVKKGKKRAPSQV